MSEWILSEQRWTSSRNWVKRTLKLAFFSLLFSGLLGVGRTYWDSLRHWSPLERLYFREYLYSVTPKILPGRSKYKLLVLMIPNRAKGFSLSLATDEDVTPLDEERFLLMEAAKTKGAVAIRWQSFQGVNDEEMYWKFRNLIYQRKSLWQWCAPGWSVAMGTFLTLVPLGVFWDRKDLERKRRGKTLKGPYLVNRWQFNQFKQSDGIGFLTQDKPCWQEKLFGSNRRMVRIRHEEERGHFLLMGDTGTGKSVLIQQMLDQVRCRGESAIIYDPALEFVPRYYEESRGDLILNPLDVRTPYWSPSEEVLGPGDAITMAKSLFPDKEEVQRFFTESPRRIFAHLVSFRPTPQELIHWMQVPEEIDKRTRGTDLAALVDRQAAPQRFGVLSSLTMVADALRLLPNDQETSRQWSAAGWARSRKGWLFISSTPETREALRPLISMWLDMLILRLMSANRQWAEKHPLWIFLDELPSLQNLPQLSTALTESRKSNLRIVLGFQGRSQLEVVYGKLAEAMLSQPTTKIFLRTTEPRAAKWISDSIGEITIERLREGVTAAVRDYRDSLNLVMDRATEPLIAPAEISGLPNLCGYLKSLNHVVKISFLPSLVPNRAPEFLPRAIVPAPVLSMDPVPENKEGGNHSSGQEAGISPKSETRQDPLF